MSQEGPAARPYAHPVRPALSRAVHDRDGLRRREVQARLGRDLDTRVLVVTEEYLVPVREAEGGPALHFRSAEAVDSEPAELTYLGTHDGIAYAMARGSRDIRADRWTGLRDIGAEVDELDAGLLVEAVALAQWQDRSLHCALCGAVTELRDAGWVRHCPVDETDIFPRTDPAMIVLVHDGADRCVLGRQALWPADRFSVLAGFVEPGESAEQAVAREVFEEVRLVVTDIRYVTSQPWPLPQSLMLGFTAQVDGDQTLVVDQEEIAEAAWFSRAELRNADRVRPKLPPPVSIAHRLITNWLGEEPAIPAWT
ncbi:MAG: NAD(+) diphosphatase [Geodermatophilaceae bacterium]|nr:NAD(+) diphosphatase [Geodermatophilaceae bacterium]MDQ3477085.1 NAD(+) diphosphatase [Actinomycetota bacterium]